MPRQVLAYFAVAKMGDMPSGGRTEVNPEGLTAAYGKHANTFAKRLRDGNVACRVRPRMPAHCLSSNNLRGFILPPGQESRQSLAQYRWRGILFTSCFSMKDLLRVGGGLLFGLAVASSRGPNHVGRVLQVLTQEGYTKAMLEKLVWIRCGGPCSSTLQVIWLTHGGAELKQDRRDG